MTYYYWSSSAVVKRALCIIRLHFMFYFFLKTAWVVATIFGLKHLLDKRNLNYEFYYLITPWAGPYMQKDKIYKKSSPLRSHIGKNPKCLVMKSTKTYTIIVNWLQALMRDQYGHIVRGIIVVKFMT